MLRPIRNYAYQFDRLSIDIRCDMGSIDHSTSAPGEGRIMHYAIPIIPRPRVWGRANRYVTSALYVVTVEINFCCCRLSLGT